MSAAANPERPAVPALAQRRPPRCPDYVEVTTVEELLPYLENVARRPYNQGLHPSWDIQRGERVLLQVDNWHDPLCIEAAVRTIERFGATCTVEMKERGPIPQFEGHDEVEFFLDFTKELAELMDRWHELEATADYDKVLWGFGGPILGDTKFRIQRMPFITPEMLANQAHLMPIEVLHALDEWTWRRITHAERVHITDPEGTDLTYTNHARYYDQERRFFNPDLIAEWFPGNEDYAKRPLQGHIWGKPWVYLPAEFEDGHGVIAGTMNHIGPHPAIRMTVQDSKVHDIASPATPQRASCTGGRLRSAPTRRFTVRAATTSRAGRAGCMSACAAAWCTSASGPSSPASRSGRRSGWAYRPGISMSTSISRRWRRRWSVEAPRPSSTPGASSGSTTRGSARSRRNTGTPTSYSPSNGSQPSPVSTWMATIAATTPRTRSTGP